MVWLVCGRWCGKIGDLTTLSGYEVLEGKEVTGESKVKEVSSRIRRYTTDKACTALV